MNKKKLSKPVKAWYAVVTLFMVLVASGLIVGGLLFSAAIVHSPDAVLPSWLRPL